MPDKGKRNARASDRVSQAINEAGWTPLCDGLAAVAWWTIKRRPNEGESRFVDVMAGDRKVQVYISPSGSSVRVYVDGKEA